MNGTIKKSEHLAGCLWPRVTFALSVAAIWLATAASQARAQTMIINPTCGLANSSVSITGSGWQEEAPLCHYNFLFDGAAIAAPQEDSSFGPPNATGTIPEGAANGPHTIRLELRDDDTNRLIQCLQDTFTVVTGSADPFNGGDNIVLSPGASCHLNIGGEISVTFNPAGVCSVTPCTSIVPVQAIQQIGTFAAPVGGTGPLNYSEQNFIDPTRCTGASTPAPCCTGRGTGNANCTPWSITDGDITAANWSIDSISSINPYYTDGGACGVNGNQSPPPPPSSARLEDQPTDGPANYPTGVIAVTFNFEDNFFCAAGENRGQWLGGNTWTWTQTISQATAANHFAGAVSAHSSGALGQPSQTFLDALTLYNTNHGFTLPTVPSPQLQPGTGGNPCQ
jgi:hypothetical protein